MPQTPHILLIVLDGWGIRSEREGNAIALAKTPFWDEALKRYPHTTLEASGEAVGLPAGQMGNSEVGHLNLGAGRVVYQDIMRIYKAIEDKTFFENRTLLEACQTAKKNRSTLHLMGLLSDGGVHSHQDHLYALLHLAKGQGVPNVSIHAILDGRDTPPKSALGYIRALEKVIKKEEIGSIATISGRYYTMDRDKRWERTEKAYRAILFNEGIPAPSGTLAIEQCYAEGETDEFVKPRVIKGAHQPASEKDAFIFFNFRPDRARQITRAITDTNFDRFDRGGFGKPEKFICMTLYDKDLPLPIAFPPEHPKALLGELIAQRGLEQLRTAETEKYAHVTYFFNGRKEEPFPKEERILVPSPKEVSTYDQKPEMNAPQVAETVLKALDQKRFAFILVNFANPDMVGHTGLLNATIQAVETIDACLQKIAAKTLEHDGILLITADHGNAEQMINNETKQPHTAHTTNRVPFILISAHKNLQLKPGILADVAPTILDLFGWAKPAEMTGQSLCS